MIQEYMPAYLEGKREGMSVVGTAIIAELNAYAAKHMDEAAPAPELYNRIIELCSAAKKPETQKVTVVLSGIGNVVVIKGVYAAKPLAETVYSDSYETVQYVELEVKDEVGN